MNQTIATDDIIIVINSEVYYCRSDTNLDDDIAHTTYYSINSHTRLYKCRARQLTPFSPTHYSYLNAFCSSPTH